MVAKLALAACALVLGGTAAMADFYVVQSRTDKKCTVVETKPADTQTVVIVGDKAYKTRAEAEQATKVVCVEKTTK